MFTVLPKIFALAPTNRRFAENNQLGGDTAAVNFLLSEVYSNEVCPESEIYGSVDCIWDIICVVCLCLP